MQLATVPLLAVGLAMDALAVALARGFAARSLAARLARAEGGALVRRLSSGDAEHLW